VYTTRYLIGAVDEGSDPLGGTVLLGLDPGVVVVGAVEDAAAEVDRWRRFRR
jgi:hypothetical protein